MTILADLDSEFESATMWRTEDQARGPSRVIGQMRVAPLNLMPLKRGGGQKAENLSHPKNIQVIVRLNSEFSRRKGRSLPCVGIRNCVG